MPILTKTKSYILAHKIISGIILVVLVFGTYYIHKKLTSTAGVTRYVESKVEKSTIISSVSGTGQVSALNEISLKPDASGDLIYLGAKSGDTVPAGKIIAELDAKDAEDAVRDAETSLTSANIAFQKFKIANSETNMSQDALKAYSDGFNSVANTFLDLPNMLDGIDTILNETDLSFNAAGGVSKTAQTYQDEANTSYYAAKKAFDANRAQYVALTTNSPQSDIENIIQQAINTTKTTADAVKNTLDYVNYMADHANKSSQITSAQNTLSGYTSTIASDSTSLVSAQTTINNNKDNSQNTDLDLQSQEIALQQKKDALQDAKDKLEDYYVRAPYAGIVANIDSKIGDSIGSSTVVATLLTKDQIAEVSMNEVDVAKIKVGEKATLTFDAIPDLTIAGSVTEIDSIGTVSQGVVTYNVKLNFDSEDDRVKPGMSVSAAIITDMKQDVLAVPNSAIKSQGGSSYVEMFDSPLPAPTDGLAGSISAVAPTRVPVEVGISNDTQTEIVSGINEGDSIVVRTITGTTTTAAATAPSLFGGSAATRTTGGAAAGGNRNFRAN